MKKYERLDFNERVNLEKLKDNELFKKMEQLIFEKLLSKWIEIIELFGKS